jgi:hypothetical protein
VVEHLRDIAGAEAMIASAHSHELAHGEYAITPTWKLLDD